MEKQAFEPTGLVPRSIIRTFDRFWQQLLPGTEVVAVQEFRISRYQVLVSIKCLASLLLIPAFVNLSVKTFLLTPTVEYLWNTNQNEIFLNSYQENRALLEMQDFSEKIYFESLLEDEPSFVTWAQLNKERNSIQRMFACQTIELKYPQVPKGHNPFDSFMETKEKVEAASIFVTEPQETHQNVYPLKPLTPYPLKEEGLGGKTKIKYKGLELKKKEGTENNYRIRFLSHNPLTPNPEPLTPNPPLSPLPPFLLPAYTQERGLKGVTRELGVREVKEEGVRSKGGKGVKVVNNTATTKETRDFSTLTCSAPSLTHSGSQLLFEGQSQLQERGINKLSFYSTNMRERLQEHFQGKAMELAVFYNKESVFAITNLLGDFVTFVTLILLFIWMRPQIIILKSFLTESIYSLSDTTKSFLLILVTDLLVGFHSPRGWEIAIEAILRHFGLPENQDFIFLFVAAFPVFLDTIFKYWIFRYLNKISPSTVATYHNMIE